MLSERNQISLNVDSRHRDVRIQVQASGKQKHPYEGPYTVVSEAEGIQIFQTENKFMTEDLVVLPIPYSETSNPEGGITVFIGGNQYG